MLWIFNSNTEMFSTNGIMNIWLRGLGEYSIEQVNYIPTAQAGVGIFSTLILGWYTDIIPDSRWHVGVLLSFTAIITGAIMLNPPNEAGKMAALFLNGAQYAGQTVMFAWANDLLWRDDAKRSIVIASMNTLAIAVYMFWSILFYNATQGPDWREGSIAMLCMGSALFVTNGACRWFELRDRKNEQALGTRVRDAALAGSIGTTMMQQDMKNTGGPGLRDEGSSGDQPGRKRKNFSEVQREVDGHSDIEQKNLGIDF